MFMPRFNAACVLSFLTLTLALSPGIDPAHAHSGTGKIRPQVALRDADLALFGEVVSRQSAWEGKSIYTTYQLRVLSVAKGDPGDEVSLRILGGEVREPYPVAMVVPGTKTLQVGERVLTFLKRVSGSTYRLVGSDALPVKTGPAQRQMLQAPDGRSIPVGKAIRRLEHLNTVMSTPEQAQKQDQEKR